MRNSLDRAIDAAYTLISNTTDDVELLGSRQINDGFKWHLEFTPFEIDGKTYSVVEMSDNAIDDLLLPDPTAPAEYFPVCVK